MSKFMVRYGSTTSAAELMQNSDAAAAAAVKARTDWAQKSGDAIVDLGAPTQSVDAANPTASSLIGGYSIVEADTLTALKNIFDGHPHIAEGGNHRGSALRAPVKLN